MTAHQSLRRCASAPGDFYLRGLGTQPISSLLFSVYPYVPYIRNESHLSLYNFTFFNLNEFNTTEIDENAIAAEAMTGFNKPIAASGIPITL